MTDAKTLFTQIEQHKFDFHLQNLYGNEEKILSYQRTRYRNAIRKFIDLYGENSIELYSAPGRTEICGNHTDHQNGMVLAASVNLDAIAVVSPTDTGSIEFVSEGYEPIRLSVADSEIQPTETGTTAALIKGILKGFTDRNYHIGGFKAYVTSDVLSGSGLSSSAALESLVGTILSGLYNDMSVTPVEIAIIGQYAENVYFGKPCGLMDQVACSVGDFVHIDFQSPAAPVVTRIDFDFASKGYALCIVDTKGSHADLTDDYAAIPAEMKKVAAFFGKQLLREIPFDTFMNQLPSLYGQVSDRALLRALHFFTENNRVMSATTCLQENRFADFLDVIASSGDSSYQYLQNVYSDKYVDRQPVPVTLALSKQYLQDNGICRVHGGGFAGTIQAFVKTEAVAGYKTFIESILGEGTCHVLTIRKCGGVKVF